MGIFRDDVHGNPQQCTKPKMRKSVYDLGVLAVIVVASCGYAVYLAFVSDKAHKFLGIFCAALGAIVGYFYFRFFQNEKARFKADEISYEANQKNDSCSTEGQYKGGFGKEMKK